MDVLASAKLGQQNGEAEADKQTGAKQKTAKVKLTIMMSYENFAGIFTFGDWPVAGLIWSRAVEWLTWSIRLEMLPWLFRPN